MLRLTNPLGDFRDGAVRGTIPSKRGCHTTPMETYLHLKVFKMRYQLV